MKHFILPDYETGKKGFASDFYDHRKINRFYFKGGFLKKKLFVYFKLIFSNKNTFITEFS